MKKKIKMKECKKKYKWEVLPSFFQLLKVQIDHVSSWSRWLERVGRVLFCLPKYNNDKHPY